MRNSNLVPSQVASRISKITSEIESALVAEEARWGDAQVGSIPFAKRYGVADWQRQRNRVLTRFVPTRTQTLLTQLKGANLYPDTSPAILSSRGGRVDAGVTLTLSSPSGSIYYTMDGSDPRLPSGLLNPLAQRYGEPIVLNHSSTLIVRVLDGESWSAREVASFVVPGRAASRKNLRITEVHYHPEPNGEAEFLEFTNTSQERIQLDGVQVDGGVQFRFGSDIQLGPAERLVLVRNVMTFQSVYGGAIRVAGTYDGNLSNGGETIILKDVLGAIIQAFTYHDGGSWPQLADGAGYSLELLTTMLDSSVPASWRASVVSGGTPGEANQAVGDANEDGRFDSSDLVQVFQGGHYETESLATWSTGDWNRDSLFTSADLVIAFQAGDYLAEAIATFATEAANAKLRRSELVC